MTLTEEQELQMLREFFDQWVNYHSMQRSALQAQELAAQRMVNTANAINALKAPAHLNG